MDITYLAVTSSLRYAVRFTCLFGLSKRNAVVGSRLELHLTRLEGLSTDDKAPVLAISKEYLAPIVVLSNAVQFTG